MMLSPVARRAFRHSVIEAAQQQSHFVIDTPPSSKAAKITLRRVSQTRN
jgi:hypothetical protein